MDVWPGNVRRTRVCQGKGTLVLRLCAAEKRVGAGPKGLSICRQFVARFAVKFAVHYQGTGAVERG